VYCDKTAAAKITRFSRIVGKCLKSYQGRLSLTTKFDGGFIYRGRGSKYSSSGIGVTNEHVAITNALWHNGCSFKIMRFYFASACKV